MGQERKIHEITVKNNLKAQKTEKARLPRGPSAKKLKEMFLDQDPRLRLHDSPVKIHQFANGEWVRISDPRSGSSILFQITEEMRH